ncbi:MAG: hypothetical protein ACJ8FB_11845 [Sphingomicrobium sp.]
MRKLILLPCVALLTAAAPAIAAPPAISNQVAPADSQVAVGGGTQTDTRAANKKICKELPSSFTRMTEKVCFTREQWKRVEEEAARQ